MSVKKNDPVYPNPYSTGAQTVPMSEHTAGRRYRVRDADGARTWGKDLTFAQAHKLKELVAGSRKSKNPIIEDMGVPEGTVGTAPTQPQMHQASPDAVRQAYEAGRAQGRSEVKVAPPAPLPPPAPSPESQNGAGTQVEIDASELGDVDLIDSAIDDSLQ